jgi:NIPSNAP protein
MTIHELRTYRLVPGAKLEELLRFFHRDGTTDYRAALRKAGIRFIGAWRTAGRSDELVWIRSFEDAADKERACKALYDGALWKGELSRLAEDLIDSVETMDLEPLDATALLRGPRADGFHELRHYRLAPGTMPRMLEFFEDVRRIVAEHGVHVLAWWKGMHDGSERFLWLREFDDAAHKERVDRELYGSQRWEKEFWPRTVGVIEERILKDLEPIGSSAIGAHDGVSTR